MNYQFEYQYPTDANKWDAYQFSDPFATKSFLCLNKKMNLLCRPNCDVLGRVTSKDDVVFTSKEIIGSVPNLKDVTLCESCKPLEEFSVLNLEIIKLTMESINSSIGFTHFENDLKRRAFSVPHLGASSAVALNNNGNGLPAGKKQLTKNESEHIKLVELACRHIASAAVSNYIIHEQKKKRRGGILGFKELASKSKLSPWHFHRVFKSITGLTPKAYGDECWKFIKSYSENGMTGGKAGSTMKFNEVNLKKQRKRKSSKVEEPASPKSSAKRFRRNCKSSVAAKNIPAAATVSDDSVPPSSASSSSASSSSSSSFAQYCNDSFANYIPAPQAPFINRANRHFSLDLSMLHPSSSFSNASALLPQMAPFSNNNNNNNNIYSPQMMIPNSFNHANSISECEGYGQFQSFLQLNPSLLTQEMNFKMLDNGNAAAHGSGEFDLFSGPYDNSNSIASTISESNNITPITGNGVLNPSPCSIAADSCYTLPFSVDSHYQTTSASFNSSEYPITQLNNNNPATTSSNNINCNNNSNTNTNTNLEIDETPMLQEPQTSYHITSNLTAIISNEDEEEGDNLFLSGADEGGTIAGVSYSNLITPPRSELDFNYEFSELTGNSSTGDVFSMKNGSDLFGGSVIKPENMENSGGSFIV